jgi:hypothetical protein
MGKFLEAVFIGVVKTGSIEIETAGDTNSPSAMGPAAWPPPRGKWLPG